VRVIRGTEFRDWRNERGATAAERWVRSTRIDKRRLQVGDIVVEVSGGGPSQPVGRTLLIDAKALRNEEDPLLCSNFCRQLRFDSEVYPPFVQFALQWKYLRGEISDHQTQTTNLRNLNVNTFLANTVILLPPYAEQKRIAERMEEIAAQVYAAREGV